MKKVIQVYNSSLIPQKTIAENVTEDDAIFEREYEISLWEKAGGDVVRGVGGVDCYRSDGSLSHSIYIINQ